MASEPRDFRIEHGFNWKNSYASLNGHEKIMLKKKDAGKETSLQGTQNTISLQ